MNKTNMKQNEMITVEELNTIQAEWMALDLSATAKEKAPDLLAALESIALDLEQLDEADLRPSDQLSVTRMRLDARAAIAKARNNERV